MDNTKDKNLLTNNKKIEYKKSNYFNSFSKYTLFLYIPPSILTFTKSLEIEQYFIDNGYEKTNPMDFLYLFLGILFSGGLFWVVSKCFHNFIVNNAIQKSRTTNDINQHYYLIKNIIFGLFFYTIMTTINFYLIYTYNPEFLPKLLGGSLDVTTFIENWPQPISNPVRIFFIFSIGKVLKIIKLKLYF
jgi:hypothetical protein